MNQQGEPTVGDQNTGGYWRDPVHDAVEVLAAHRHELAPDVLRSLADIWSCGSAARYGAAAEKFWLDDDGQDNAAFYGEHDVAGCEGHGAGDVA
jgi:hypothetical protein